MHFIKFALFHSHSQFNLEHRCLVVRTLYARYYNTKLQLPFTSVGRNTTQVWIDRRTCRDRTSQRHTNCISQCFKSTDYRWRREKHPKVFVRNPCPSTSAQAFCTTSQLAFTEHHKKRFHHDGHARPRCGSIFGSPVGCILDQ